jgi:hypothetical protein
MTRNILILLAGLLLGAVATAYFLGAPGARSLSGIPLRPPDPNASNAGTVAVTIDERFFESLLGTIFGKLGSPQLKLSQIEPLSPMQPTAFQAQCDNVVVLNPEGGNVKTGVRFTGGKIIAPLAFSGSYRILTQCIQFKGTARAAVDLSFDQPKQTVFGRLNIEEVVLEGTSALVSGLVTTFVRKAIDERLNPFEVLRVSQLALSLPVKATGGTLKAQVNDVRSEVQEGTLKLYLIYDFNAERDAG